MQVSRFQFPDLQTLTLGLKSAFVSTGHTCKQLVVLGRELNVYASTFPSEIVMCRLDDGRDLQLLCKYSDNNKDSVYGHRGGVTYEAAVYRHILQSSRVSRPTFHGDYTDSNTGATWLIVEYLDKGVWIDKTLEEPTSVELAASWIGQFQAEIDARLTSASIPFLNTYDAEYYLGWARRTSQFAGDLHRQFPWLRSLCAGFEAIVPSLLEPPLTVIHGEYTPQNIMIRGKTVYPVDWESAAIAKGELDLSSLADVVWPEGVIEQCELEYQRARWPKGSPANLGRLLGAARLYTQFRWLGDRPSWTAR